LKAPSAGFRGDPAANDYFVHSFSKTTFVTLKKYNAVLSNKLAY